MTDSLTEVLGAEDQMLQSMPDCSPTRWHRAHTSWFFETFVLGPRGVPAYEPSWAPLFNSYYEAVGPRFARARRGVLSRPTVQQVGDYRHEVTSRVATLLETMSDAQLRDVAPLIELGIAHEQQHQELILTDILHAFSENPLIPVYRPLPRTPAHTQSAQLRWRAFDAGLITVGADASSTEFVFDNETPAHRVWVDPFLLADRLLTVGELKEFIRAGGYQTPSLWLSEGIDWVRANNICAPMYSRMQDGELCVYGLHGERVAQDSEPITHVSYYEADALAAFFGARLPSEYELEFASATEPVEGRFLADISQATLMALPAVTAAQQHSAVPALTQLWAEAWQWTRSSYEAYPGYRPTDGALGEYNAKFMINQRVLRGGSYLTPQGHMRRTYRNFWPAQTRFQVTGVRLARSV
jgi:ergothioneine biosynthesis protein EgtB